MSKKKRTRPRQLAKLRAELQQEIESKCPFCESMEVGHFEIHHLDENPGNHEMTNLLLLCPTCHSKITKGDISCDDVYAKKNAIRILTNTSPEHHKTEAEAVDIMPDRIFPDSNKLYC